MKTLFTVIGFALPALLALLALLVYDSITSMREYEAQRDKQMNEWLATNECKPVRKQAGRTVWFCADGALIVH